MMMMITSPIRLHLCKKCEKSFDEEETIALFKQHPYHLKCFRCVGCEQILSHHSFYLDEKLQFDICNPQVFCQQCYFEENSFSCRKCDERFTARSIIIQFQGNEYHENCFICQICRRTLIEEIFYKKNDDFICQTCLQQVEPCLYRLPTKRSSNDRCKKCGEEFLDGQTIAMYNYDLYHRQCFHCVHCKKTLIDQGLFRHEDGCLYCLTCQIDCGPRCSKCDEPFFTGEILCQFDGKQFHQNCFQCVQCEKSIESKRFYVENRQIICELCRQKDSNTNKDE